MLAILLAAGKGRRLGTPKAFADLGGLSAYEICVRTLLASGLERIAMVVSPEGAARLSERTCAEYGLDIVVNQTPEKGQTSSVKCALRGVAEDFLLQTVDHPLVRADDIRQLLRAWEQRAPGTDILAPSVQGRRGHPCLHAVELIPEFLALPDESPAHTVIRQDEGRVQHVTLQDEWIVRDIDEPLDLEAAQAEFARRTSKDSKG
jgi:molybdenum cofactor cytidylyltransferase